MPTTPAHRLRADHLAALYRRLDDRAADLEAGDRVLEIGTGSGYQAAVLAELGVEVYTVEIVPELATGEAAAGTLGYDRCPRPPGGWLLWLGRSRPLRCHHRHRRPRPPAAAPGRAARRRRQHGHPHRAPGSYQSLWLFDGTERSCWPATWAGSASCRSPVQRSSRSQFEWPGTPPVSTWRPSAGAPTMVIPSSGHFVALLEPSATESRKPG